MTSFVDAYGYEVPTAYAAGFVKGDGVTVRLLAGYQGELFETEQEAIDEAVEMEYDKYHPDLVIFEIRPHRRMP